MEQPTVSETAFPSFSMVLETENLETADLQGLSNSLASLVNQTFSPQRANEVLLIDSGDVPPTLLDELCQSYPWISVRSAPAGTGYYKAKMLGAELATGEIIVYCDSDCVYEPNWLRNLLLPFGRDSEIQVVAGETKTRGRGPYGTAMAMTYIFPQYSGEKALRSVSQYFLNNVAFRRDFLLANPIPANLPLYRGNCAIHAFRLRQQGDRIWQQPLARATHAPPNGLSHFFWRFLLIGCDYYWQKHILAETQTGSEETETRDSISGLQGKLQVLDDRVGKLWRDNPRHLLYLPFALPIIFAALVLILAGYFATVAKPKLLLQVYQNIGI